MSKKTFWEFIQWLRVQFFRFWTAATVVGAYGYFWWNSPEYLTWWKRTVNHLVEFTANLIPYPWGDRFESTLGNLGMWTQVTIAILALRAIAGGVALVIRKSRRY